jgi:hypothetical protein
MHILGGHEVSRNLVQHVHMSAYEDFFQNENHKNIHTFHVTTLALGSRPTQRHGKVQVGSVT